MSDDPPTPDDSPPATDEESPPIHHREYHCPGCGYDLAGLLDAPMVTCPECARMSSSTLLKRLGPPPTTGYVVLRLSLPFIVAIGVHTLLVLGAHRLGFEAIIMASSLLSFYAPAAAALVAITLARAYWSEVSRGAHPRTFRSLTLVVTVIGSLVSLICAVVVTQLAELLV